MPRTKMIVAGLTCLDITPEFKKFPDSSISDIFRPGKTVLAGNAEVNAGGSVSNTGLAMQFLGGDTVLMGKIGNDLFGKLLLDYLEAYPAEKDMAVDDHGFTSYSVILAVPGIDRIFIHNPGAADSFTAADIDYLKCEEALVFHMGYPNIMSRLYENEGKELTEIFRRVKSAGCITSMDFAAVDSDSAAAAADWDKILKRTLPYVDFFMPSIEEILALLEKDRHAELKKEAAGRDITEIIDLEKDVIPLADRLLSMGCAAAIIKCGARGIYYKTTYCERFYELGHTVGANLMDFGEKSGFEEAYMPDRIVSGTGAGDTSIAAFLMAAVKGYSLEMCVKLAAAEGACCVTALGALEGLKPLEELEKRINSGWKKVSAKE